MTPAADPTPVPESTAATAPAPARPPLLSRAPLLRLVSVVAVTVSFFLLLSAVPTHADRGVAALATSALMLSPVLGELAGPRIFGRYGHRGPPTAGLLMSGALALTLPFDDGAAWTASMCLVRGLASGLTTVARGALTVALIPAERRVDGPALGGTAAPGPALRDRRAAA
ncbi:MFS transporter [Streptomyces sp. SID161]|uniref:MFS transporter n=1 Tax=Streptomyces sp. SID161 TaxID=2690251 RepID=UPI00136AB772|nr:MFS transporter [Streptomyces sp. SID161]MYW41990.1 hypothetical protein [Streptomyces sp. SID161]